MLKIILLRNIRIPVASQRQNILNPLLCQNPCKFINFAFIIMKAGQMHHGFYVIFILDLFGKLDRPVTIGASPCAKGNTDKIRTSLTQYRKCLVNIFQILCSFWWKNFKRQALFLLTNICDFHSKPRF